MLSSDGRFRGGRTALRGLTEGAYRSLMLSTHWLVDELMGMDGQLGDMGLGVFEDIDALVALVDDSSKAGLLRKHVSHENLVKLGKVMAEHTKDESYRYLVTMSSAEGEVAAGAGQGQGQGQGQGPGQGAGGAEVRTCVCGWLGDGLGMEMVMCQKEVHT